ncbi:GLL7 protein, partial [Penelope pileata]|nr:GLL7 protein [Penelope pileata]
MRILYQLLVVLLVVLQGVAGQGYFPRPPEHCLLRGGYCFPGLCQRPYRRIGACHHGNSCCSK